MRSLANFFRPGSILQEGVNQYVFIANILSLIFSVITVALLLILVILFGWTATSAYITLTSGLFLLVVVLNKKGLYNIGRIMFCLIPVYMTMLITIVGKVMDPNQSYIIYFDSRFILLVTAVLPAIAFDLKERTKIVITLGSTFLCLLLFDPIHNLLGIGYYQRGFDVPSYYFINYVVFVAFFGLVASIFILKWKAKQSSDELETRNLVLSEHETKLETSNKELASANKIINEQQQELQDYNLELENRVAEKSRELLKANEELIKSNNELRQFSFTVSHNVRGPVASLLGLTDIIKMSKKPEEILQIAGFIHKSARELDITLQDLSKIIDIRNELYKVREKILIETEWNKAVAVVGDIQAIKIKKSFTSARHIFGIRPMVQSIFYNLISNSIKYKSPDRALQIEARSYTLPNQTVFEIEDNGLGIDLQKQKGSLFKLYKRFHQHVGGRGLGLYLVKSQMEIMGGQIEVQSEPDKGTLFKLIFQIPPDPDKQIFFENDSAQLYYDANINNTVIIWKKKVSSNEYRQVFEAVLLAIKTYKTPGWIADLRFQGAIGAEDQVWFISNVLKVAFKNGLQRIGTVGFSDPVRKEYYERMIEVTAKLGIELRVFDTLEKAIDWMDDVGRMEVRSQKEA
ncbi:MAG: hypothetical protein HC811_07055 [Flammeovirgaceae bacterium]|nr:hypothetical protein [Flammeovirgaceae bacterium]